MNQHGWSSWQPFPDPEVGGYLFAPFGYGVYELRNRETGELVLYGRSKNVASRMSSLLPNPPGSGTRNNQRKRKYVSDNICKIEYRTKACTDEAGTKEAEKRMRDLNLYIFRT